MYKKALEITIDTDKGSPIPVKGTMKAQLDMTPATAAVTGAVGGGALGYLLGPEHKGWRALTTLAGALLGGSGAWYAVTKMASLQKTSAPQAGKENWIKGNSYTNIGASPGRQNPLTAILGAFSTPHGYAGDPTGRGQYALTEEDIQRFGTAYSQYRATRAQQQQKNNSPRGFVNPYRTTPARFTQPAKPQAAK